MGISYALRNRRALALTYPSRTKRANLRAHRTRGNSLLQVHRRLPALCRTPRPRLQQRRRPRRGPFKKKKGDESRATSTSATPGDIGRWNVATVSSMFSPLKVQGAVHTPAANARPVGLFNRRRYPRPPPRGRAAGRRHLQWTSASDSPGVGAAGGPPGKVHGCS